MKIGDVMTRNPVTVRSDASLADAAHLLLDHRLDWMPVLDGACELVGVITEADIMRRADTDTSHCEAPSADLLVDSGRCADDCNCLNTRRVDEVMSTPVSIDENSSLDAATALMKSYRVKCLPVTRKGKLCGTLSRLDVLRVLFERQPTRRLCVSANHAVARESPVQGLSRACHA